MKKKMRSQIISMKLCENECIMSQDLENTQRSEKNRECSFVRDLLEEKSLFVSQYVCKCKKTVKL